MVPCMRVRFALQQQTACFNMSIPGREMQRSALTRQPKRIKKELAQFLLQRRCEDEGRGHHMRSVFVMRAASAMRW